MRSVPLLGDVFHGDKAEAPHHWVGRTIGTNTSIVSLQLLAGLLQGKCSKALSSDGVIHSGLPNRARTPARFFAIRTMHPWLADGQAEPELPHQKRCRLARRGAPGVQANNSTDKPAKGRSFMTLRHPTFPELLTHEASAAWTWLPRRLPNRFSAPWQPQRVTRAQTR